MRSRTHRGHYDGGRSRGTGLEHVRTGDHTSVLTDVETKAKDVGGQTYPTMRKSRPAKAR